MANKTKKTKPTTYRVDIMLPTMEYANYNSRNGCEWSLAHSLADHLKRNGAGGRIVELPSGKVLDEWELKIKYKPSNTLQDKIQALRDKHFPRS